MKTIKNNNNDSIIINELFKEEKWKEARQYLLRLVKQKPNDHWLLSRVSTTYYEEKNYEEALEYVQRAMKISPRCPLVLWDYAGTLDMLEKNQEAITVYKRLIRRGVSNIAYGECGEGLRWARSLVNDCYYRLGLIYASTGQFDLASKYIKKHIDNRNRNCASIYNLQEVKKDLTLIQKERDPRKKEEIDNTVA